MAETKKDAFAALDVFVETWVSNTTRRSSVSSKIAMRYWPSTFPGRALETFAHEQHYRKLVRPAEAAEKSWRRWGNWVVGIEGDWSYKNSENSLSQSSTAAIAVTGSNYARTDQFSGSVKQKSDSSIRARVGTLVTPWSLLYVTGWRCVRRNQRVVRVRRKPLLLPGQLLGSRPRVLVDEHSRHGNDRGDLERYAGWQHGWRGMGNRDRAPLESQGRVPLHGLRQLHQDLRSDHPLHRQLRGRLKLHRYAVEQREHRSEGIVPYLPHRSRLRPVIASLKSLECAGNDEFRHPRLAFCTAKDSKIEIGRRPYDREHRGGWHR